MIVERYYFPYRPDIQHVYWIYLSIHAIYWASFEVIWNAHISWIIQLPPNWQEKAALYVLKNGLSLQVLDRYGIFTPEGKEVLEEMRLVHAECLWFLRQADISVEMLARVKSSLQWHYQQVQRQYPGLMS